ncbi:O-antigen translocase [uncultured Proteiniphilum sp.]|uniref:O-antigen translocase n=1 Tax=uncultured Proteiniphilum sp. TaxID=497637 RepID=UPI00260F98F8|nr:O-antigen translocase [uncultured Proteiniphilum sp.]
MTEQKNSYRQIMKATSLFGGVQFFQILISVVRSKFVAILLGPAGMGIVGLLTATTGLVSGLTNFGLGTSAVKNISEANATGDKDRISKVISVLRRLVWITGLLGTVVTLLFSPWLSEFTFGNKEYTFAFVWISITLIFNQLSTGELVLLQALRRLQHLAKANVYGSLAGLVISIPLYYKFGIRGIVPVIIITAFITLFFSWYFGRKIKMEKMTVSRSTLINEGKSMMVMGFMISLSGLITLIAAYLLRIFINRTGSVDDVGFYTAGFTIINTYVGMIFTAMGTDYYPRLSVVAADNQQCRENINQQSEIALLILAPILIFFLVFVNWAVVLLYSSRFLVITGMIYWASLGIFFKAVSWAIAFVFLAKGAGKLFFWNEFIGSCYTLLFSMLGYHWGGLTGLGFSFLLSYLVYLIQVFVIAKVKYHFSFHSSFTVIFLVQFLLALLCFVVMTVVKQPYAYLPGVLLIAVSSWYSFRELEQRIGIKELIQNVIQKIKRK